jgi:protein ImuB
MKPGAAASSPPVAALSVPCVPAAPRHDAQAVQAGARLWLALEFPALPISALGPVPPDAPPLAVSVHEGRIASLLGVDARARDAGVREGMSVTAATLICPSLQVRRHDPMCEAAALQGLAAWCGRYTSQVSLRPPRALVLEIGASLRLFGGLGSLLERMRDELRALGHAVVAGVAPTPAAARLLARAAVGTPVIMIERLAAALAGVPVTCMDLPPRVCADLHALGVYTFADCARLPRDGLNRRFGPQLLLLLDRALGRRADPQSWWTPPPVFQRRLDLAFESADRAVLLQAARCVLHELGGFLRARACAACALELQLAHRNAPATRVVLELVSPSRDPEQLLSLVAERVQRVPIAREVLYLGLRVDRLVPLAPQSGDLFAHRASGAGAAVPRGEADVLVQRLGARLGRDAVHALVRIADHRPEHASAEPAWHQCAVRSGTAQGSPPALPCGMPLWLLPQPRRLDGGTAAAMLDGALHMEQGPWRIESGWWDGQDVARDYYVARSTRGTRYWVFRERREPRHWFVHGIFA